jgi:hypothetical protein
MLELIIIQNETQPVNVGLFVKESLYISAQQTQNFTASLIPPKYLKPTIIANH